VLGRNGTFDFTPLFDQADHGQRGPVRPDRIVHPGQIADPHGLPGFDAALILLDGRELTDWKFADPAGGFIDEELPQGIGPLRLVILYRQQIISATIHDVLNNLGLAAHRIEGNDTAFQIEGVKQHLSTWMAGIAFPLPRIPS
jgi:hypothetical protein